MDALRIKCNKAGREVGTKGGVGEKQNAEATSSSGQRLRTKGVFFSGGLGLLWMHTNTNIDSPGARLDKKEPNLFVIKGASKQGRACPSKCHVFCPFVCVHVSERASLSLK